MEQILFDKTADNKDIYKFKIKSSKNIEIEIINYGAIIKSIKTPDKFGEVTDIVLGYDSLIEYINDTFYMGCIIGRYSNRINKGEFYLNDKKYTLPINNGNNHLHGGFNGFNKSIWNFKVINEKSLELSYFSKDGEEGYPANLDVKVIYTLNDNELIIDYFAKSDNDTIVNLTNHSYFNLLGKDNILEHSLLINSNYFTPIDENLIPTGEFLELKNTPLDFSSEKVISSRINNSYNQLLIANGYDHNYIINSSDELKFGARLTEKITGRVLEVYTTKPALQFYSGNFLSNIKGKNSQSYSKYSGLCLETQYYPDSPNKSNFPNPYLSSSKEYRHKTIYKFNNL